MFSESKVNKYSQQYLAMDNTISTADLEAKKTVWRSILEVIYKDREDILYKKDSKGDYIYNENGFKKIDVFKIVFNLAKLISGLLVQLQLEEKLKNK